MLDDREAHVESDQPDECETIDISSDDSSGFEQQSTLSDEEMRDHSPQSDQQRVTNKQAGTIESNEFFKFEKFQKYF